MFMVIGQGVTDWAVGPQDQTDARIRNLGIRIIAFSSGLHHFHAIRPSGPSLFIFNLR